MIDPLTTLLARCEAFDALRYLEEKNMDQPEPTAFAQDVSYERFERERINALIGVSKRLLTPHERVGARIFAGFAYGVTAEIRSGRQTTAPIIFEGIVSGTTSIISNAARNLNLEPGGAAEAEFFINVASAIVRVLRAMNGYPDEQVFIKTLAGDIIDPTEGTGRA